MSERTFPQLCAVICINEIEPRRKTHGFRPPSTLAYLIALAEFEKATTRKDTRRYLDAYYAKAAEPCP
jgi:hypothetical protein